MKRLIAQIAKSILTSAGVFTARHYQNVVMGYALKHDLPLIVSQPHPVCFDIGANLGQTIQFFQDCFARPTIHAFEPSSITYAALAARSFGKGVLLHQIAFGEQVGRQAFRNYEQPELSSFLELNRNRTESIFAEEDLISVETVTVETLDHFCSEHRIQHIDLLKIDTQGFELAILRGGRELFEQRRVTAVLLELNFSKLYEEQADPLTIIQFLREYNLQLVDFYEKERMNDRELSWTTALFKLQPAVV